MNHYHVTRGGTLLIPSFTDTVLRSVTSESVLELGRGVLGIEARQERIELEPFLSGLREGSIVEAGGFGTAAVVSAVGAYVFDDGSEVRVGDGGIGPCTRRIYEALSGIQRGLHPAPEGWLFEVPHREPVSTHRATAHARGKRAAAARRSRPAARPRARKSRLRA